MPYKYAIEQICDYLAAGKAYQRKNFTYQSELAWWNNRLRKPIAMHPALQDFTTKCLTYMANKNCLITKHQMKQYYYESVQKYC